MLPAVKYFVYFLIALTLGNQKVLVVAEDTTSCSDRCSSAYTASTLIDVCTAACEANDANDAFHVEYPYELGPMELKPYPELTGIGRREVQDWTGTLWARVSSERERIQFKFVMDNNPEPFFPYFAMHLHQGPLTPDGIGGHILTHIAGQGDIVGCFTPRFNSFLKLGRLLTVCSPECTSANHRAGNCYNPTRLLSFPRQCRLCNVAAGRAYFCRGGCQGDGRILGNSAGLLNQPETVVPSRACDLGNPSKPSNPVQNEWIQGLNSNEFSGNPEDGDDYSPYSIGVDENFDLWCTDRNPFLVDMVFSEGQSSYVALHANFNATGLASLLYGDAFAAFSTIEGGPTNCYVFGNTQYPCVDGLGELPGLGDTL